MRTTHSKHRPVLTVLIALSWFVPSVVAQGYGEASVEDGAKVNKAVVLQCLKTPGMLANPADKQKFDDYFQKYYFPSMTLTAPDKLGEIFKQRDDLFKKFIGVATDAQAQQYLIDLTYTQMVDVVKPHDPPYHPAARYNAILIIGLLDQKPSPGAPQPPEPYAKATKALTAVVNSATTGNQFPPSVILGAVNGLDRHVQYRQSLPPEAISGISAALVKLVTHDDPIQEMDRDTYSWLRLRAASVLARLGVVGEKNEVHDAIVKLSASCKSIDDRCAAAALLEKLEYKDVKLDDAGTAEPLFALARDVAAAEDKRAQDFQDTHSGGGTVPSPGRFAGPRPGSRFNEGGAGGTETAETFPRRQTLTRLSDLNSGLKKLKSSLPEETQKKADAVLGALKQAITVASDKNTVELTLADELHKMAEAINKAVPGAVKAVDDKAKETQAF